jgi:hypothetical protein
MIIDGQTHPKIVNEFVLAHHPIADEYLQSLCALVGYSTFDIDQSVATPIGIHLDATDVHRLPTLLFRPV